MAERGTLAYKTEEELSEAVEAYFERVEAEGKRALMTGLARQLGINRNTLVNYAHRDEFGHVITRARERVQEAHEEMLFERDTCNGAKFSLANNFGWAEKQDVNHGVQDSLIERLQRGRARVGDES